MIIIIASFFLLLIFIIIIVIFRHFAIYGNRPFVDKRGHSWAFSSALSQPAYCSVKKLLIFSGYICENCGIIVSKRLLTSRREIGCCKVMSLAFPMKHHWVSGNVALSAKCVFCNLPCGLGRIGTFCTWCKSTVHDYECKELVSNNTCLGSSYSKFLIMPFMLKTMCMQHSLQKLSTSELKLENTNARDSAISPVLVLYNTKSGSRGSSPCVSSLRAILNASTQIFDLSSFKPVDVLKICCANLTTLFIIVICGGDGTISWVLQSADELKLQNVYFAIVPLGTGNDLSRTLNWGGNTVNFDETDFMNSLSSAKFQLLDQWYVNVIPKQHLSVVGNLISNRLHFESFTFKSVAFTNYFSIGVDAAVCLNVHRQRHSFPFLFSSRLLNKLWYFTYGTKDVFERTCLDLSSFLLLKLDGRIIELPALEGIVFLNIPFWGGGCRPLFIKKALEEGAALPYAIDDGWIEVFGIYSSFHCAQMHVGLEEPYLIGRCQSAEIDLLISAPVQADGEPWQQSPATFAISFHGTKPFLRKFQEQQ